MGRDGAILRHNFLSILLNQLLPDIGMYLLVKWFQSLPCLSHLLDECIRFVGFCPGLTAIAEFVQSEEETSDQVEKYPCLSKMDMLLLLRTWLPCW